MGNVKEKNFYGWRIAFLGFILMCTSFTIAINCASLFVKPITETLGASRSQVSLISTILTLVFAFSAPFIGKIIKKFGIKMTMSIGCILASCGLMGYSISSSVSVLYIFSAVIGLGLSCCTLIPINMLVNAWFIEKKGFVTGIIFAGSGFGGFVFSQVIAKLLVNYTWNKTYFVLGLITLVLTLPLILLIVKESPSEVGQKPYGSTQGKLNTNAEVKGYMLKEIKGTSTFISVSIACFIINLTNMGIVSHVPAHLSDLGYPTSFAANVTSMFLLGIVFGKVILGYLLDKIGGKQGLLIGTISMILGFAAMLFATSKVIAILFPIVFALGGAMATVAIAFLTGDIFGNKDFASIYGLINLIGVIGAAFGSPISGVIYDKLGSYNVAWIGYIVLSIIMYGFIYSSYKSIGKVSCKNTAEIV